MKLVAFIIGGDNDFGALSFKDSGVTLQQVWDAIPPGRDSISAEEMGRDDDWQVSIADIVEVHSFRQAQDIMSLVDSVAGESGCGDYDGLKHTGYEFLIVGDDE